jgi:deoxyribose-phosphate aldolase
MVTIKERWIWMHRPGTDRVGLKSSALKSAPKALLESASLTLKAWIASIQSLPAVLNAWAKTSTGCETAAKTGCETATNT